MPHLLQVMRKSFESSTESLTKSICDSSRQTFSVACNQSCVTLEMHNCTFAVNLFAIENACSINQRNLIEFNGYLGVNIGRKVNSTP